MTFKTVIGYLVLILIIIIYVVYTIRFTKELKTSRLFSKKVKTIHFILIWLIPFLWVFVLKNLTKSIPGSHEFENKKDADPFTESGLGIWMDPPPKD